MDDQAVRDVFEAALRSHSPQFGNFFLAKLLDMDINYGADTCVVSMPVRDFMFNPQGTLHGGIAALALDVSMGHLINHSYGGPGVTLEMKVQYLRAVREGTVRCEGRFLKRGRSIAAVESRMTDEEGKLMTTATSTWKIIAA